MAGCRVAGAACALAVGLLIARPAGAQVRISPESPHGGEKITITADPSGLSSDIQPLYRTDTVYAMLRAGWQGLGDRPRDESWTVLKWDGQRFVGEMQVPDPCEGGWVELATAERYFEKATVRYMCRGRDGSLPPGALILGLARGARDKSHWREDIAADLATLRAQPDQGGWAYWYMWDFTWREEKTPVPERSKEVERVDHETREVRSPGMLASLVVGYTRVGNSHRVFERLKELVDRFPESEQTTSVGLLFGSMTVVNNPEYEDELNGLVAQVANAAPQNKGLREFHARLTTKVHGVPLSTLRVIGERWMRDRPASMEPHYMLATALAREPGFSAEAESEISKAIELSLQPHPYDFSERRERQRAFRLRSELRAKRGDLIGAVSDARMAQLVAGDKTGAEDLAAEAGLWQQLGYGRKAEDLALEAYEHGSLEAEGFLKKAYVARTENADGFRDYLLARLRATDGAQSSSLTGPALPAFSAATLDGAQIDPAALRGKVTVLDFWFVGCAPCRAERPKLNQLVDEFGDRVRFIGFALTKEPELRTYLESNPFKYEIVPESESIVRSFGVQSFPTHLVVDATGRIVWTSGSDDDRVERLRAMVYRMVARQHVNKTSDER